MAAHSVASLPLGLACWAVPQGRLTQALLGATPPGQAVRTSGAVRPAQR